MCDPNRPMLLRLRLLLVNVAVPAIILAAVPVAAQILYGSLVGVVKDSQGAFVPGATVTITNKETGLTRETTTNSEGAYNLVNVPAGTYDVKVSLTGFREAVRSSVPVTIGEISRVDMTLEVGTLTETVTVASESQLLQTDKADVHTELKSEEITSMPLNRFRNYQALINLAPGTMPMSFGNAETDTPARSMTTNINGQANTNNQTRTDGSTNVNIWLPNHNMYVSPAETIDTVNVSTSSFDAEQGMAGGAAITVLTKSGTNQFRGSAFEFYNSDKLNASPYFFGSGDKPSKLPIESNTYGGTLGGPIKRNRLFFFGSFEGYKRTQSSTQFFDVPDQALRRGDFSNARNTNGSLQIIYNPFTGAATGSAYASDREPFLNNQIPASIMNPIALKVLQLFPLPNTTGIGAGGLSRNYQRDETRHVDRDNYDVKMNWNRTSSHQIWGKFSHMNAVVDDLTNYLGPDPNASGDGGFTKVYQVTAGQTWTLSPTLLMDSTFGFSRQKQDVLGPDFQAGYFGLDVLGIPGTNDPVNRDPRYAGYPRFDTGFSLLGNRDGWNPIFRDERTYSLATNLTKMAGRHDLRGGYYVNFLYLDHWQPESDNPRGRFQFATNSTALRGGQTSNFYNQYAAFLLGLVGTGSKSVQNELMTGREWQHAFFFRDRWTATPKLTFDLGLRWEYYPIMKRAGRGGLERLDLDTLEVILGGAGDNPKNVGLKPGLDNFAPRAGAIYRLNNQTVLRSGYGVTYNAMGWARPLRGDQQYPVTIFSSFFNPEQFAWYGTLDQGIPIIVGPDQSRGRVPLPNSVGMTTPEPGNVDRGYVQTWNVAFERRLAWDVSVDVAYVGAKGTGGYGWIDINAPTVLGTGNQGRPYFSRGRSLAINVWGQRLRTRYNSMQVAVNKPFTHGLLFKGAYTLSKSMNEADADGRTGLNWNTPSELGRNWARAGFDRPHNFQVGFAYQLPWQSSGGYDNILKAIVDDWQINGVFGAFSGTPFTVTASGTVLNTPSNQQTADLVGDVRTLGKIGSSGTYFDTAAWAQPTGIRFGNTGRNQFRGPGAWNLDMSAFRSFPMRGQSRLELRVEGSNILNHPVFANPENSFTSPTFMVISGIAGGTGLTNASYVERQIRLGLRFTF